MAANQKPNWERLAFFKKLSLVKYLYPMISSLLRSLSPIAVWLLLASSLLAQTSTSNRSSNTSATNNNRNTGSARATTTSSSSGGSSNPLGPRQYRSNTMLGDATIQIDPESRSVVIVTDEATHAEMLKVIDNLDHPKPQVLIKVVFVEVTLDKSLDVGLEGTYKFNLGNAAVTTGTSGDSILNNALVQSLFGLAQKSNGTVAAVNASNWSATLHALESKGNLHVLSRPSIMARNNQEAVIVVGQEVPFITNSQITDQGATINTIQYRDVGIILRVTPFINSNKTIEMIVSPEISKISDQTVPISTTVNAAVIDKRSAETVVVTPDATTVVIGGMMQKQEQSIVDKVPILGSIPILGIPFRHTVKSTVKTELLIFLTPYIVEGKEKLKQLTLHESNQSNLIKEGFTPEDINSSIEPLQLLAEPYTQLPSKSGTANEQFSK